MPSDVRGDHYSTATTPPAVPPPVPASHTLKKSCEGLSQRVSVNLRTLPPHNSTEYDPHFAVLYYTCTRYHVLLPEDTAKRYLIGRWVCEAFSQLVVY